MLSNIKPKNIELTCGSSDYPAETVWLTGAHRQDQRFPRRDVYDLPFYTKHTKSTKDFRRSTPCAVQFSFVSSRASVQYFFVAQSLLTGVSCDFEGACR